MADDVIAIFGPTGVGKTAVAVALADRLRERGEEPVAVSADALQVYRGLETLTCAPTAAEQRRLEHRLTAFLPIDASFSVAAYARLAHAEIDRLLEQGRRVIVVGGTGLYMRAALAELDLGPAVAVAARDHWTSECERVGPQALHAVLARRVGHAAAVIAPQDRHRIVRALAIVDSSGPQARSGESQLWTSEVRRPTRLFGLVMNRRSLYERIGLRVDAIVAAGAPEEVRSAHAAGASDTARKALGFTELLAGDVPALKRRTRRLAKRQLTWMRKLPNVEMIDVTSLEPEDVAATVESRCAPIAVGS